MSKYIPKKKQIEPFKWSSFLQSSKFREEIKEDNYKAETKKRIEAIPLEQLTFRDLYEFPFRKSDVVSWVYDKNGNFIFQFEIGNKETREKCLQILNGELEDYKRQETTFEGSQIFVNGHLFITIRGWGNLTGIGAHNLDGEYAGKIQDTLGEYILEKLGRNEKTI